MVRRVLLRRTAVIAGLCTLLCLCVHCAKDPCLEKWGCGDCNCLFDTYQAAQSDIDRMTAIKECYDRACK